jgi:hypothetical protein
MREFLRLHRWKPREPLLFLLHGCRGEDTAQCSAGSVTAHTVRSRFFGDQQRVPEDAVGDRGAGGGQRWTRSEDVQPERFDLYRCGQPNQGQPGLKLVDLDDTQSRPRAVTSRTN